MMNGQAIKERKKELVQKLGLGKFMAVVHNQAVANLTLNLPEGEEILYHQFCTVDGKNGVVILTEKRLLATKGMKCEDILYSKITSVESAILKTVVITTGKLN
jgi:hypothetical protein